MRAFLNIILLLVALPAMAANSITPGTVELWPTFECIGVRANFTGDDDADATFHVRYKKTAGTVWFNAFYHTNHIDRRSTVGGFANPFQNQGRLSIVGCTANTSYDVAVIWTDADGGSSSNVTSVTTRPWASSLTNGNILYVDAAAGSEGSGTAGSPYKTITNALAQCSAGDTIAAALGAYTPFIWTKSGTPTAYIKLCSITNGATISGGTVWSNLFLQASNVIIDNISFSTARTNAIRTSAAARDVYVQNCTLTNVGSAVVGTVGNPDTYAINLESRTNWSVLTNTISGISSDEAENVHLIAVGASGVTRGCVIADNEIYNSGYDGIGGGGNYGPGNGFSDSDIFRNHIYDCNDDGIEGDGDGINLRISGGYIHTAITPNGSGLSMAPIHCGPAYVWRVIVNMTNLGALKQGNNSGPNSGPVFYFQNDFCTDRSGGGGWEATGQGGGSTKSQNDTFLNNIFNAQGNTVYLGTSTNNFWNYNVHRSTSAGVGGSIVYHFNETTTDYTLTTWRSTFGFDLNGLDAHPGISNIVTGQLTNGSPAMNAGTVITNFNDSSSAWPFEGAAPDIGAFELFGTRDSDGETNAYAATATIAPGARKPRGMR